MLARLFEKRSRFPSLHARRDDGNRVDPAGLDGFVSADLFIALFPEQLAGPGNMFGAGEPVIVLARPFAERRPGDPQPRILRELVQEEMKIVFVDGDVRIQIADDVIIQTRNFGAAGIDGCAANGSATLIRFGFFQNRH